MPLGTFAPGYYAMTYNAIDVGLVTRPRRLRRRTKGQPMIADKWGDSTIDIVTRGADVFLAFIVKEWTANVRAMLWPYSTTDFGKMMASGRLASDLAKQIILTAEAGSPAATNGPLTITAAKAILAPENDTEIIFGNDERDIPVLLQLLPYVDGNSDVRHFIETYPS